VSESSTGSSIGFGNTRYPYYYGPEGRLVLVDKPNKVQLLAFQKAEEHDNNKMPKLLVVKEQKKNEEVND
jgi:hypothetical protein